MADFFATHASPCVEICSASIFLSTTRRRLKAVENKNAGIVLPGVWIIKRKKNWAAALDYIFMPGIA
jgi:hypothetical protein